MVDSSWDFVTSAYAVTALVFLALAARALFILHAAAQKARDEDKRA